MSRLVFVESTGKIKDLINLEMASQIITLTPQAAYELSTLGFEYKIPEDYYLWQEDERYKDWFQSWLDQLEQIVVSWYPFFKNVDIPVTIHCMTILKNLMDVYVRTTLQYFEIIKKEEAEDKVKMILMGIPEKKIVDVIDDELWFNSPSLYYRLVNAPTNFPVFGSKGIYKRPKIKSVLNWGRCLRFIPSWKKNKTLLFASVIPDRIREAKLTGYRVGGLPIPKFECSRQIGCRPSVPLFQNIDDEFDFPPFTSQEILWPRIKHFLNKIVPEIQFYAEWYEKYFGYEKYFEVNKFSCLVFNRRNQLYQYGALIGARMAKLPCTYIRHGWDAYSDEKLWWRVEQRFRPFDYFICPNKLDIEFYKPIGERNGCKVI
uniref:Uncharacterized protein n=1 Tax=viral metagenome TaxID=1070528 RepID=A0A6M3JSS2_9ZZZZ